MPVHVVLSPKMYVFFYFIMFIYICEPIYALQLGKRLTIL